MDKCFEVTHENEILEIVDVNKLSELFKYDETLDNEVDIYNMTSLGNLILLGQSANDSEDGEDDDTSLHRLSLAYERLKTIPQVLIQELSPFVRILDISNNEFENLDFLSDFKEVTSLICDHNKITSHTDIPYLPKLELLWMNHCKIEELYPWAKKLQIQCPNLKYLSLMGNPIAPSYLNGGSFYEYLQYRFFIISLFPNLIHLDDRTVTTDQIKEAQKMYHRPLIQRLVSKTSDNLPHYLRNIKLKMCSAQQLPAAQKNLII